MNNRYGRKPYYFGRKLGGKVRNSVHTGKGPLACSSASRNEIAVPVFNECNTEVIALLDSEKLNTFDQTDKEWLEKIVKLLEPNL